MNTYEFTNDEELIIYTALTKEKNWMEERVKDFEKLNRESPSEMTADRKKHYERYLKELSEINHILDLILHHSYKKEEQ